MRPGFDTEAPRGSQGASRVVLGTSGLRELAVGRDEGDGAVILKAREPHALVELHVLQLHGLAFATCREWGCEGVTGRP